jgi:hypothetical protein
MKQRLAAATLCLGITFVPISSFSKEEQQPIDQYYQSFRDDARAMYQQMLDASEKERQRKVREKLPPTSQEVHEQAKSLYRAVVYNKIMFHVICVEDVDLKQSEEAFAKAVEDCASRKDAAMSKFWRLLDRAPAIGERKLANCEIRARDFSREKRFPPFDFLADREMLKILDYEAMNECMASDLQ